MIRNLVKVEMPSTDFQHEAAEGTITDFISAFGSFLQIKPPKAGKLLLGKRCSYPCSLTPNYTFLALTHGMLPLVLLTVTSEHTLPSPPWSRSITSPPHKIIQPVRTRQCPAQGMTEMAAVYRVLTIGQARQEGNTWHVPCKPGPVSFYLWRNKSSKSLSNMFKVP